IVDVVERVQVTPAHRHRHPDQLRGGCRGLRGRRLCTLGTVCGCGGRCSCFNSAVGLCRRLLCRSRLRGNLFFSGWLRGRLFRCSLLRSCFLHRRLFGRGVAWLAGGLGRASGGWLVAHALDVFLAVLRGALAARGVSWDAASPALARASTGARKWPVCECLSEAMCSGVPLPRMVPPRWPPSGPRSTIQS